jgi:hypothetical protein
VFETNAAEAPIKITSDHERHNLIEIIHPGDDHIKNIVEANTNNIGDQQAGQPPLLPVGLGSNSSSSHNGNPKRPFAPVDTPPNEALVTITETVRTIVDNDQCWHQVKQQMKEARVVTSMGVREVCAEYINDKSEEIRKEKLEEMKRLESLKKSNLNKLRKRLSIFG